MFADDLNNDDDLIDKEVNKLVDQLNTIINKTVAIRFSLLAAEIANLGDPSKPPPSLEALQHLVRKAVDQTALLFTEMADDIKENTDRFMYMATAIHELNLALTEEQP